MLCESFVCARVRETPRGGRRIIPGMSASAARPLGIRLRRGARVLELRYAGDRVVALPFEYLRVFSPSAEVRGHGLDEPQLVAGKRNVQIVGIEPVGQYALRLRFDDGHASGLYSWAVLQDLAEHHDANWQRYLARLEALGMSRDSDVVKLAALPRKHRPVK